MKKSSIFILFLTFFQISFSNYSEKSIFDNSELLKYNQNSYTDLQIHGFVSGTLIKCALHYIPIEQLQVGDKITGINDEQEIVAIKKWTHCDINYYALTTQDHGFYIYPEEFVHNMDFAYITTSGSLCLGLIELCNPVTVLLGALIPLTICAIDWYNSKKKEQCHNLNIVLQDHDSVKQARIYYETRRKELVKLHQELLQLKNNLNVFMHLNYKNTLTFSSSILSHIQYNPYQCSLLPNIATELKYSINQKENLFLIREQELQKLEAEIVDIETTLGFHLYELIERSNGAYDQLLQHMKIIDNYVKLWNQNLHNLLLDFVIKSYQASFMQEALINDFEQKVKELQIVKLYYDKLNSLLLKKTSNIYSVLEDQISINNLRIQELKLYKNKFNQWRQLDENHLRTSGILTLQLIELFKKNAENPLVDNEKTEILQAKKRRNSMKEIQLQFINKKAVAVAGGADPDPEDDEDEEKKFFEKLVKNSTREAFSDSFGKFYKDSETSLWWSKDKAFHGGPHYKVYKEVAKGFEWVFNANKLGQRIVGQHKGPIGMFIPYKNIRFLR